MSETPNNPPSLSDDDYALLSAYLDDMLDDDARAAFEARLADDNALRRELAAMRQTVQWLNDLPRLKAPRDFTITREMQASNADKTNKNEQTPSDDASGGILRPNWGYALGAVAAVFVLIIGAAVIIPALTPSSQGDLQQVAQDESREVAAQPSPTTTTDMTAVTNAQSRAMPSPTMMQTQQASTFSLDATVTANALPPQAGGGAAESGLAAPDEDEAANAADAGLAAPAGAPPQDGVDPLDDTTNPDPAVMSVPVEAESTAEVADEAAGDIDMADASEPIEADADNADMADDDVSAMQTTPTVDPIAVVRQIITLVLPWLDSLLP